MIRPLVSAGIGIAAAFLALPGLALADDPKDPAMRTAAARAHDRELTRQLNLGQLAHVRERDAAYAVAWNAMREQDGIREANHRHAERTSRHRQALADYHAAQADYQTRLANWRNQVAACNGGNRGACR